MSTTLRFRTDVLIERATAAGDLTSAAIAVRTGVKESSISRIRAGLSMPSLETLVAFAATYGGSLDDFIDGKARPAVPKQRTTKAAV